MDLVPLYRLGDDIVKDCTNVVLYVEPASSAEKYAKENGISYVLRK